MNVTRRKKFDIEGIISPLAMASLQAQFVVGNRQQFGFLLGEIIVADDTYRCDDYFSPNTFYITSVMPVFDAASFQKDMLKTNDKCLSDVFLKQAMKSQRREPIIGWYFEGNPKELLKGKDYSLHVKLLRQVFLLNQKLKQASLDDLAFHALFAAVVSYTKKRFSRDFSVGFQGFDEKNQLRMYEVKVNVVDHYFRPRYETDACLINHSHVLKHIQEEIDSEPLRNVFLRLQNTVFDRPEPYCYKVHGHFVDRCLDLLCDALKHTCSRTAQSRNIELESQLFDYKAFEVDSRAYNAAMTVIDKTERNLNLYSIMQLLNDLDYLPPNSPATVDQVDQSSPQQLNPQVFAETLRQIQQESAEKEAEGMSVTERPSSSTEKMDPQVLCSGSSDQIPKSNVQEVSLQNSQNLKEIPSESTLGENMDTQVEVTTAEPVHEDAVKTYDADSSSQASSTDLSKSKSRRKRKRKSVTSSEASSAFAAKSAPLTSSEENLGKHKTKETTPFSKVPRDQLLVYNITPSNKSNAKLPDSTSVPDDRISKLGETMSATIVNLPESGSTSTSSYTSDEEVAGSQPTEMQIRIVKRNTSARINIPHTSIEENPTKSIEKSTKKKDESSGPELHESVVESFKKSKAESVEKISASVADSGNTSSEPNKVAASPVSVIVQNFHHSNAKSKEELKYESSQTDVHVSGLTDTSGKSSIDAEAAKPEQSPKKVTIVAAERNTTASQTSTSVVSHKNTSTDPPAAPALADSSPVVCSRKSKSQKSTGQLEIPAESSKLPWPKSKNACIIIPNIKPITPTNKLWKYTLRPIPDSLLTALKSLRAWRNQANVEAQCSGPLASPADSEQLLPDFQECFGSLLDRKNAKSQQLQEKSLPPIPEVTKPLLPGQFSQPKRRRWSLSSRTRFLLRKSTFLSYRCRSPLATVFEERRSMTVQYEDTTGNESDTDERVIPLCLLGDTFMINAESTERKYAALSTNSSSEDTDTETSTSAHSSGETFFF